MQLLGKKERPILFSAPMVRAILTGNKTQTRRVVKLNRHYQIEERDDGSLWPWMYDDDRASDSWLACPYGMPGDRLWVRETWRTERDFDHLPPRDLDPTMTATPVQYEAGPHADVLDGKLRPSMFMPRWASRITLEVTAVRVQRLQDISEADAIAEGVYTDPACPAYDGYRALWESINGPNSWDANPWVWAITFKRT